MKKINDKDGYVLIIEEGEYWESISNGKAEYGKCISARGRRYYSYNSRGILEEAYSANIVFLVKDGHLELTKNRIGSLNDKDLIEKYENLYFNKKPENIKMISRFELMDVD